jgi:hypothetical protein
MRIKVEQLNSLTSKSTRRINVEQSKDTAVVVGVNMNIKKIVGAHGNKLLQNFTIATFADIDDAFKHSTTLTYPLIAHSALRLLSSARGTGKEMG